MSWDKYAAVVLSLLVLLGGLAFAVGNQSAQHRRCITEQHIGEGDHEQIDVGGSLWPPGTECTYHYSDGSTTRLMVTPSVRSRNSQDLWIGITPLITRRLPDPAP